MCSTDCDDVQCTRDNKRTFDITSIYARFIGRFLSSPNAEFSFLTLAGLIVRRALRFTITEPSPEAFIGTTGNRAWQGKTHARIYGWACLIALAGSSLSTENLVIMKAIK